MRTQADSAAKVLVNFFCRGAALAVVLAVTSCGGSSTAPTPTPTPTPTPGLSASFTVTGTPCVAPSAGNVTCTFSAVTTGGQAPFTFAWRFTNPANAQEVTMSGQAGSPALGCGFSTGVVTFNTTVSLTVTPTGAAAVTSTGTQSITRAAGACGT